METSEAALDGELRATLDARLDGIAASRAARAVERLIANYRGETPTDAPVLRDEADVTAYAAYRMPATFQAVRAALAAFRARAGEWAPGGHVDVGGGTGAASWAVADAWPDGGHTTTVLDWARPALDLGAALARTASHPALRAARWQHQAIGGTLVLPPADLVTISYVLGELAAAEREPVLAEAARASTGAVVVVEPGTPAGYARVIQARRTLVEAGFTVLAPCPHDGACPVTGHDWCHFAARVARSALHRQVKGGTLPYEDEKFSYVAAARASGAAPAAARVVRHPQIRKGQVLLDLCERDGELRRTTVSKRHGPLYRAARDAEWGDSWPPPEQPTEG